MPALVISATDMHALRMRNVFAASSPTTDAALDTPPSTPSAPPSRLWSAVPGSASPNRVSTAPTSPRPAPFPVSSSPSQGAGGDVKVDEPHAIPDADTDLDMDIGADDGEEDDTDARAIAAALRDAGVDALGRVLSRLTHVLERSALYSSILERQMREARERHALSFAQSDNGAKSAGKVGGKGRRRGKGRKGPKRRRVEDAEDEEDGEDSPSTKQNVTADSTTEPPSAPAFPQPHLITGAMLHPHQLEGLQWMLGLDEQGISGILGTHQAFNALTKPSSFKTIKPEASNYATLTTLPRRQLEDVELHLKSLQTPTLLKTGRIGSDRRNRHKYLALTSLHPRTSLAVHPSLAVSVHIDDVSLPPL
ncbi:hypothetical protein B0H16DRAFT_1894174 [Mycena metata]|uniref:Uncharacterized protein n=1 Tax=Mycena metata TaxID=1033252 RepID=A0AAD7HVQ6_9AGAR|nr:hypothetical protein B0H16DRAFT_1894174 [Mycena metata]